jgi:hypothetical protein
LNSPDSSVLTSDRWKQQFESVKDLLATLCQFGAILLTAFGGFYRNIAPPDDQLKFWPSYGSLLAGLVFLVCIKLGQTTRRVAFLIAVIFAAILPAWYFVEYQNDVRTYATTKKICGTHYTERGGQFAAAHGDISKDALLFAFGGKAEDIWTEESINIVRLRLGFIYSYGLAFFALALLTALQESKGPS